MKQRLAMLLLLFLGGVFVQTAAAAALSPAQAREALGQMYTSRKTNGNIEVPEEKSFQKVDWKDSANEQVQPGCWKNSPRTVRAESFHASFPGAGG